MAKAVVVGGAGFIGSNLTEALVAEGYEVHVIDNLSGGKREHVVAEAIFHEVDMRDYDSIAPVMKGADTVFLLAALPRVQFSIEFPQETNEVNIGGLVNVLKASVDGGVRRVVYSASSSAYGDQANMPLVETMLAHPLSPYGLQKYVGELYCRLFNEVYGIETVSLRYFNVYGKNQNPDGAYALVIGKFLKQKAEGKPLTITGDGEQTRDFTHVRDVVRANLLAMKSEKVGKGEAINIGAGDNHSINEVAEFIGGAKEYVAARLEPKNTLADTTRAKELLGWEPTVKLEEGIAELKQSAGL
ncbi:MAG: NAD-dependent epimerase/dehydratase family protein [Candidatus Pacebacteria bacterium]|nr:NAD-dependent epimerase/dehydratase family protein [Candidatus Paceibacterota bacterium]